MVTRYDVISSRLSSHFWVKMHFFHLLLAINVKLIDEMMPSAYLCVILHAKHQKLLFIAVLNWFLTLGKIKDGDHCCWCHRPPAAPPPIKYISSCWKGQRLSTEGKIVLIEILQHTKNSGEGFHQPPSPHPLVPHWGYEFVCMWEG